MPRTLAFFDGYTGTLSTTGDELWATDGTASATGLVADVLPGPPGSDPRNFAPAGTGGVVFTAVDHIFATGQQLPTPAQLFVSNGTTTGTAELNSSFITVQTAAYRGVNYITSPSNFTPLGDGHVLFVGITRQNSEQLWVTDSTVAGTGVVADFPMASLPSPSVITSLGNGRAVFDVSSSTSASTGLWGTDGTSGGTVQLSATAATAYSLGNGQALTITSNGSGSALLGVTDGTAAGTTGIQGFAVAPINVTAIGGSRALFSAEDTAGGAYQLWVSDGTAGGTAKLVQGPAPGTNDSQGFAPEYFTPLGNGRAVFAANDGSSLSALWVSDGTAGGTALLQELAPAGSTSYRIIGITALANGKALVKLEDYNTSATALYATDGTTGGTVLLKQFAPVGGMPALVPDSVGSSPIGIAALPNGKAVFAVPDTPTTVQLWSTDGTAAGTAAYAEAPRAGFNEVPVFTVLPDGRALFPVANADGYEAVWATGGTAAGTGPLSGALLSNTLSNYPNRIGAGVFGVATVADLDPLFDSDYYNAHNTDVAAAGVNAYAHFLASGGVEGRSPDPFFDSKLYLAQNSDVAAAGVNPLTHFEQNGWREGRDPSLLFSDAKYLAANPDVAAAGVDPLLHYLTYGQKEGRATFLTGGTEAADPLVNPTFYDPQLGATLIPTGLAASQQAAWSYDTTGWLRGLNPDALFDTSYYLSHNPDVAAAHVNPLLQYEQYGWKEGRDPSAAFSTAKYLQANPDVTAAGVDPLLHYVTNGQAEGRAIFPA